MMACPEFSSQSQAKIIPFLARFRTRLILLVLLPVVPALLLALHTNFRQRKSEKTRVREATLAIAQLVAANEQIYIKNARQLLATLAPFSFLVDNTNRSFTQVHFINLRKLVPDYLDFGIIEPDGTLFCSAEKTNGTVNLKEQSHFKSVIQTKRFAISEYETNLITCQPALHFGYPILNADGEVKRVLYSSLNMALLSEAAALVHLPPGGTVTVFDRIGNVVARVPNSEDWVGRSLRHLPLAQATLQNEHGVFEMPGLDGVHRLFSVATVSDGYAPGLFVSVGVPSSSSFENANQILIRSLLIMTVVALVAFISAQFYSKHFILRPIDAMVAIANRLGRGDCTTRTGVKAGHGELSQLASAFDNMAATLERRQIEIQTAHAEIRRMNAELEQRVKERTAQLEAVNKELESFSSSVSHDLRAPLRHVAGFADMLDTRAANGLDMESKRFISVIKQSAKRMGCLIDDLLAFSRLGRQEINQSTIESERLVHEVIGELELETQGRSIEWIIGSLPSVEADRSLLHQVWVNLISNAIKYTRPRQLARIELGSLPGPGNHCTFFVRDNGVGFDMTCASKLFGVFQRLHGNQEFEGTGIGLANVRRVVARHGGNTWAEAEVGAGATIYFSIPVCDPV